MLNIKFLVSGLSAIIPGGITIKDFSAVSAADSSISKEILEELAKNNIGKKNGNIIEFSKSDKLKSALFAIKLGGPVNEVSQHLDWKDFEGLAGEILESKGFEVVRNLFLTKPKREIDVVGQKLGITLLIDCKHWKSSSSSSLKNAVLKQIERTKQYVAKNPDSTAVPMIVTLFQERIDFIQRVPLVPIFQLSSFVDEFYGNLEDIETIKSNSTKKQRDYPA